MPMGKIPKKLILLGLVFVFALAFWFSVSPLIQGIVKISEEPTALIQPLIFLALFSAVISIYYLAEDNIIYRVLASVLTGLAYLAVSDFNTLFTGTFSILILFYLYAGSLICKEDGERIKVNIRLTLKRGLPLVITPILLIVSFAYFLDPARPSLIKANEMPITLRQAAEKTLNFFSGQEMEIIPRESLLSVGNSIIDRAWDQISNLAEPYQKYLPPIFAFGLFLVLQGLSFIFVQLGLVVGMALFTIMRLTGLVKIEECDVRAEKIVI